MLEDALASMPAGHRESHLDAALIYSFLSDLDYQEGQLDRAAEYGRASLEIYQRTQAPDPARLAEAYTNLANVELRRRSFLSALALYEDALALRRRQLGNGNYQIGVNEGSIAETLVEIERYDEAMHHLVEAERIFQRSSGRERGTQAWILTVRGEILAGQRQFGAAVPVLEHALDLFGDSGIDPTNHALAMWTLARALHALGMDEDRVRSLAERAHVMFAAQGAVDAHNRDAVASFLGQLPRAKGPAERQHAD
jgi:tetratricopeptide (TPR) repeat protein